jgi:hypothetical protein
LKLQYAVSKLFPTHEGKAMRAARTFSQNDRFTLEERAKVKIENVIFLGLTPLATYDPFRPFDLVELSAVRGQKLSGWTGSGVWPMLAAGLNISTKSE